MKHARIYRLHADGDSSVSTDLKNDEPVGRAFFKVDEQHWIKFDNEWHGPGQYNFAEVSKAEYETDEAFALFPILKVAYRPVRMWFKLHQKAMHLFMICIAFITLNLAIAFASNPYAVIPLWTICSLSVIWQIGRWEKWKWWARIFDIPVSFR